MSAKKDKLKKALNRLALGIGRDGKLINMAEIADKITASVRVSVKKISETRQKRDINLEGRAIRVNVILARFF
jgi:hypothetical protein